MISAAPVTTITLTCFPRDSKYLLVRFGNDVAILLPSLIWETSVIPDSSGAATARWQYPKRRLSTFLRS